MYSILIKTMNGSNRQRKWRENLYLQASHVKRLHRKTMTRSILYLAGLYLTALGIVLTTQSRLGVAAVTCLATSLSMLSGYSLGTVLAILYCGFVGIEYLILRQAFTYKHFLQLCFAFLFGFFTDSISWFLQLTPITFFAQFLLLWLGLAVCATGVVITIQMDVIPCAPDGLVHVISTQYKLPFGKVKVMFDCICVCLGLTISLLGMQSLGGFGLTTFLSALFLGRIMGAFGHIFRPYLHAIAFESQSQSSNVDNRHHNQRQ